MAEFASESAAALASLQGYMAEFASEFGKLALAACNFIWPNSQANSASSPWRACNFTLWPNSQANSAARLGELATLYGRIRKRIGKLALASLQLYMAEFASEFGKLALASSATLYGRIRKRITRARLGELATLYVRIRLRIRRARLGDLGERAGVRGYNLGFYAVRDA